MAAPRLIPAEVSFAAKQKNPEAGARHSRTSGVGKKSGGSQKGAVLG